MANTAPETIVVTLNPESRIATARDADEALPRERARAAVYVLVDTGEVEAGEFRSDPE